MTEAPKRLVLSIDPMPAMIAAKKDQVNANFSEMASRTLHRDQAHMMKRQWALTQDEALRPEAELRGITVEELSALILSKTSPAAERELKRQQVMARIEACTTPDELEAITTRGKTE